MRAVCEINSGGMEASMRDKGGQRRRMGKCGGMVRGKHWKETKGWLEKPEGENECQEERWSNKHCEGMKYFVLTSKA